MRRAAVLCVGLNAAQVREDHQDGSQQLVEQGVAAGAEEKR